MYTVQYSGGTGGGGGDQPGAVIFILCLPVSLFTDAEIDRAI